MPLFLSILLLLAISLSSVPSGERVLVGVSKMKQSRLSTSLLLTPLPASVRMENYREESSRQRTASIQLSLNMNQNEFHMEDFVQVVCALQSTTFVVPLIRLHSFISTITGAFLYSRHLACDNQRHPGKCTLNWDAMLSVIDVWLGGIVYLRAFLVCSCNRMSNR